jgi:hypothetical protein
MSSRLSSSSGWMCRIEPPQALPQRRIEPLGRALAASLQVRLHKTRLETCEPTGSPLGQCSLAQQAVALMAYNRDWMRQRRL